MSIFKIFEDDEIMEIVVNSMIYLDGTSSIPTLILHLRLINKVLTFLW